MGGWEDLTKYLVEDILLSASDEVLRTLLLTPFRQDEGGGFLTGNLGAYITRIILLL